MQNVNIFWFRRDLRLEDNAALYHSLRGALPVVPIFIFDKNILDKLEDKKDRRVEFIYQSLFAIQRELIKLDVSMEVYYGTPLEIFSRLIKKYNIDKVFANHDYEPYALERESLVNQLLSAGGTAFHTFKDHVIFEKNEILKEDGRPYTIFTPYSKKWKAFQDSTPLAHYPTQKYFTNFLKQPCQEILTPQSIGFQKVDTPFPSNELNRDIVEKYTEERNFPGRNGTSKLGLHLRFGTVSIRAITKIARSLNETFLNELIWRDFYQMILWHFPHVGMGHAFKPAYDFIEWRTDEGEFDKWCNGQTGYPIVDAGMRELKTTGFMHNRVRMIVASFLSKHLLLDWRLGEAWFAQKLLDFDLAANNGGWQWAAGSGCDAAPYFRIFNPYLQTQKFDPQFTYIKKWVPEFQEFDYPRPIVVHEAARKRCLEVYGKALKNNRV
jgi:deoxyribodipyrimidine photo-lyase